MKQVGEYSCNHFKKELTSIPNCKILELKEIILSGNTEHSTELIKTLKPRHLTLKGHANNRRITKYLFGLDLDTLRIAVSSLTCSLNIEDHYRDWLTTRKYLKELNVEIYAEDTSSPNYQLFKYNSQFQFKLKKLSIEWNLKSVFYETQLSNFLLDQTEIEDLSLTLKRNINQVFALFRLNKLRILDVTFTYERLSDEFMEDIVRTNENIIELKYCDRFRLKNDYNNFKLKCFLHFFPKLEVFHLKDRTRLCDGAFLKFVDESFQLRVLKLERLWDGHFSTLQFNNLEELWLELCVINAREWEVILKNAKCLRKIVLDAFLFKENYFPSIVTFATNLEHLTLGYGFYPNVLVENLIRKLVALKHLQITFAMSDQLDYQLSYIEGIDIKIVKDFTPATVLLSIKTMFLKDHPQ